MTDLHISILKTSHGQIPRPDWHRHMIRVWSEDECLLTDPDTKKVGPNPSSCVESSRAGAWKEITGGKLGTDHVIAKYDGGDAHFYLYSDGWVRCVSYDGGHIYLALSVK